MRANLQTGFGRADRVLVYVDTEQAHEQLINSRLAYVSVSRGPCDAQIYTNDAEQLGREVSHRSAIEADRESVSLAQDFEHSSSSSQAEQHSQVPAHSLSLSQ